MRTAALLSALLLLVTATETALAQKGRRGGRAAPSSSGSFLSSPKAGHAGFRINKSTVSGASSSDKFAFQGGMLLYYPLANSMSVRTGALLIMRDSEAKAGSASATVSRMFLDVPATFDFAFNSRASVYFGFDFGLKLSSSCSGCSLTDEKSFVFQPLFGLDAKLTPTLAMGFFYEMETEYHKNWKQSAMGFTGTMSF